MTAIKWAGKSRDKIEGLLAPYGGPDFLAGKDFDGEFFSPNTDFTLSWFGDWERPLLYHHGKDESIKTSVVGRIKVSPTDKGLWMQAQLDKAHAYYNEIASLVDEKALGLSSGSVGHLVSVDHKSGEIKSWPLIEGSLTPTPANPEARAGYEIKSADAIEHLAVLGVEAPQELADLADANEIIGEDESTSLKSDDSEPIAVAVAESVNDDAVKAIFMDAIKGALTSQALHDAAVASGAACSPGETTVAEPAPLLAIAGKSAETPTEVDLDAIKAQLRDVAVATAKELLGRTE